MLRVIVVCFDGLPLKEIHRAPAKTSAALICGAAHSRHVEEKIGNKLSIFVRNIA
jgi:hypothetical protein